MDRLFSWDEVRLRDGTEDLAGLIFLCGSSSRTPAFKAQSMKAWCSRG